MPNLNKVLLMGNLTRDPELRYTPGGLGITSFGLAVNTPMGKDDSGNAKTETLFVDLVAFGRVAETIAEYLKKGAPIYVEGRLRYRTWEDNNGNKRSKHEVVVNNFQFLSSRERSNDNQGVDFNTPTEDEDIPF
jgi:single-strand DNA-binding protein